MDTFGTSLLASVASFLNAVHLGGIITDSGTPMLLATAI